MFIITISACSALAYNEEQIRPTELEKLLGQLRPTDCEHLVSWIALHLELYLAPALTTKLLEVSSQARLSMLDTSLMCPTHCVSTSGH